MAAHGSLGGGGPLLRLVDMLQDLAEGDRGLESIVREPVSITTDPPSPMSSLPDPKSGQEKQRLPAAFEATYSELKDALTQSGHSWTGLTQELCATLTTADKLVASSQLNLGQLSEQVTKLENIVQRGQVAVNVSCEAKAAGTKSWESAIDILEPTKEILRLYDENSNSKESSCNGRVSEVQNKLMLEHMPQLTEEDILALARVGRISEEFRRKIESLDSVVRLDRRVCELEKENEVLRYQRDTQACDLKAVYKEVETFLDMVESFLDVDDSDRQQVPDSNDSDTQRRTRAGTSSSSIPERIIALKGKGLATMQRNSRRSHSPDSRKTSLGQNDKRRGTPSPTISPRNLKMSASFSEKGKLALSPGIRSPKIRSMTSSLNTEKRCRPLSPYKRHSSPSPRQAAYMSIADTRKRKWPESERQAPEVVHGRVVPPGNTRWRF
ncbi:hypothetical protein R1sor_019283 [Riccia sorocarpa]|uniref:Uncharacterized protein n=1 Tax=Riccia sorocarpa TaxID=122646 RepID=A0ABD3IG87_9MARC